MGVSGEALTQKNHLETDQPSVRDEARVPRRTPTLAEARASRGVDGADRPRLTPARLGDRAVGGLSPDGMDTSSDSVRLPAFGLGLKG